MALEIESILKRRRFTLEEYHRMGEAGILDEDERVELIDGEIVEMTPIGPGHASIVARLNHVFAARLGDRALIWAQNPVTFRRQRSELQPDIVLLPPRPDFYRSGHPEPADTLLVIEVMDSSVARDRRVKLPIYARSGVREVWLIDVTGENVEVCRDPTARGYLDRRVIDRSGSLGPQAVPDVTFRVVDLIG